MDSLSDCDKKNLILIGADAVGLFPSMDTTETARIVREEFINGDLKLECDWKELSKYISMNRTESEIRREGLGRIMASRLHTKGPRPGVTEQRQRQDQEPKTTQIQSGMYLTGSQLRENCGS